MDMLVNATATSDELNWPGGIGTFDCIGTFGGTTVTLQFLGPDGTTWIDAGPDTTLTAAGAGNFQLRPGKIRAEVDGGSPTGLYASAWRIQV